MERGGEGEIVTRRERNKRGQEQKKKKIQTEQEGTWQRPEHTEGGQITIRCLKQPKLKAGRGK